ncbi:formate--tetrahydrofolate ligase [Parasalinivibrio latis]
MPIQQLAQNRLGLGIEQVIPYGHYKAKLNLDNLRDGENVSPVSDDGSTTGKLVLVTAITPTPAGEGKTTTSIGLTDALNLLGINTSVCLREPSLGPCFGLKGGAAGGGRAQAIPMEDLNLHFNGDIHAITAAHNLLAAMIDNHIQWGNEQNIDSRRVVWRRVVDLNDRALRNVIVGLGGKVNGIPRETGFDITVASEIMAVLCLAENLEDLQKRLGDIIVAYRFDDAPVTARALGADGAMTVLLKDAMLPNLIQTLEYNPVFVHGGPFANIAHGCSSVAATRAALAVSDVVVTEAGFGADLGGEKFLDIKCRLSGLRPDAAVLVCTIRALKSQGGVEKADLNFENVTALQNGASNLVRHIQNLQQFGLTPVVCINRFPSDTEEEIAAVKALCLDLGVTAVCAEHWAKGGNGALELAQVVAEELAKPSPEVTLLYPDEISLEEKVTKVATKLYGASGVSFSAEAKKQMAVYTGMGFGHLPVCIAKTPYSFSSDPKALGAPDNHDLPVREMRLMAGAGFVVAVCGDVMTMPGLPASPAALNIRLDDNGLIEGLF